jgi:hypothetical protein
MRKDTTSALTHPEFSAESRTTGNADLSTRFGPPSSDRLADSRTRRIVYKQDSVGDRLISCDAPLCESGFTLPQTKKPPLGGWWTIEILAGPTGLEPATSGVTGRRSNQLNYDPAS